MSPRIEAAARERLDAIAATRTVETRGEHSVWDIAITRGADVVNRSITIWELKRKITRETLRRKVRVAELAFAMEIRTPPPTPEDPDPDWVDVVGDAQANLDAVDELLDDLGYLRELLERGGER